MANPEHLAIIRQGVSVWNDWKHSHPNMFPDLTAADFSEGDLANFDFSRADLSGATFAQAQLRNANLREAKLVGTDLSRATLTSADLSAAELRGAVLIEANLTRAILREANLSVADLTRALLHSAVLTNAVLTQANLTGADLRYADLSHTQLQLAILVQTNLSHASIAGASIYGASVWNVDLTETIESDLIISAPGQATIQVDNLEVAQFIFLILNNRKLRHVIDSIRSKIVVILGRFTPERKQVLDCIRTELRARDYLPVLFDLDRPSTRDMTEIAATLAAMSRFLIVESTDVVGLPSELAAIVPNLPSLPVQPIRIASGHEYPMFAATFKSYPWVLPTLTYSDTRDLTPSFLERLISPAEKMIKQHLQ